MSIFKILTAWILIVSMGLTGCATMKGADGKSIWSSPGQCVAVHTAGGAALGALAGAGLGSLVGGKKGATKGAIAGGVGGAVLAFAYAWGECFAAFSSVKSTEAKNYSESKKEIHYKNQQGNITKIEKFNLTPSVIAPGEDLKFNAKYVVMTDTDRNDIPVTETRILKVFDPDKKQFIEVGSAPAEVIVAPRMRNANGSVPIPDNAAEGKYMIAFKVDALDKSDVVEMPFTIKKKHQTASIK